MGGINGINGLNNLLQNPVDGKAGGAKGGDNPTEIKKALQDFEALFINQMLKVMRESVSKSDLFHGGSGEEIYTSLFDTELSKLMSKNDGMGLATMLMDQFGENRQPEGAAKTGPAPLREVKGPLLHE